MGKALRGPVEPAGQRHDRTALRRGRVPLQRRADDRLDAAHIEELEGEGADIYRVVAVTKNVGERIPLPDIADPGGGR